MRSQTSSMSNGRSGTRIDVGRRRRCRVYAAIQPAWRPITSTTITRLCDSAVVCRRSIASVAICTAVWKPNVKSVPAEVVVDRLRDADDRHAVGRQAPRDAERVLAADRDQRVDALAPRASPRTRRRAVRAALVGVRARRPEDRAAAVQDARRVLRRRARRRCARALPPTRSGSRRSRGRGGSTPSRTTPRITAFRPGQSPPPVRTPIRMRGILACGPDRTRVRPVIRRQTRPASDVAATDRTPPGPTVERHRVADLAGEPAVLVVAAPRQELPCATVLDDARRVPASAVGAEEERVLLEGERAEARRAREHVRAALGTDPRACEPRRAVVALERAEEHAPRAAEPHELRDLELAQLPGRRQRRPRLPGLEVVRPRVADHAAPVGRPRRRPRAEQRVEAAGGRVLEDPRIAPVLLRPRRVRPERLVPPRVGLEDRAVALPVDEVVRGRAADPLHRAALGARDAAVEHVPAAAVADDAAGPRREVVERAGRPGLERGRELGPRPQVARDRVAHRRVMVAQLGVAERARRLEVEEVDVGAVDRDPEVPDPAIVVSQAHVIATTPSHGPSATEPSSASPSRARSVPISTRPARPGTTTPASERLRATAARSPRR